MSHRDAPMHLTHVAAVPLAEGPSPAPLAVSLAIPLLTLAALRRRAVALAAAVAPRPALPLDPDVTVGMLSVLILSLWFGALCMLASHLDP